MTAHMSSKSTFPQTWLAVARLPTYQTSGIENKSGERNRDSELTTNIKPAGERSAMRPLRKDSQKFYKHNGQKEAG